MEYRDTASRTPKSRLGRILQALYGSGERLADHRAGGDTAWLDGLRGLAALFVLSYHWHGIFNFDRAATFGSKHIATGERFWEPWRLPIFYLWSMSGSAMVKLFFMISGYVLTIRPLRHLRDGNQEAFTQTLTSTIFRRGMRLWIPTLFILTTAFIATWTKLRDQPTIYPDMTVIPFRTVLRSAFYETFVPSSPFKISGYDALPRLESVLWTIPVEFYGSCVCFLSVVCVSKIRTGWIRRALLGMMGLHCATIYELWYMTPFYIGVLFADFGVDWKGSYDYTMSGSIVRNACLAAGVYFAAIPPDSTLILPYTHPLYDPVFFIARARYNFIIWHNLGGALIVYSALTLCWFRSLLDSAPIQYLGRISFALYLTHYQFLDFFLVFSYYPFLKSIAPNSGPIGDLVRYIVFWMTTLPVMFVVANWFERTIDRRAIQWAKQVEAKIHQL